MSRTVVGRMFWKELRTQGSLWLGVTCLVIGIQALVAVLAIYHRLSSVEFEEWSAGIFLAAYIGATLYAIASGAASFTEEREGNTAVFLRTVPMTYTEAFVGKWGYGLVSTGVLFVVLAVAATICCFIAWFGIDPDGAALARSTVLRRLHSANEFKQLFAVVWIGCLIPVASFAFCALYSLLLSDGVLAALSGTFSTIIALVLIAKSGEADPAGFAKWLSLTTGALIFADYWLTGIWLQSGTLFGQKWTGRRAGILTGKWSWLTRSRGPLGSIELLRIGEPVVPWRRATQRLAWKEIRQAWPCFKVIALVATAAIVFSLLVPNARFFGIAAAWLVALATPLVMGVGAYQADQKGRAYRFLAVRGVTPDGSWIIKHAVWIGHLFAACAFVLVIDQMAWQVLSDSRYGFQGGVAYTIRQSFGSPSIEFQRLGHSDLTALGVVALYILLGYSIGQRFSFAFPKGLMAFGIAGGATVAACLTWAIFESRAVPIVWTIGVVPPILLAYTWAHTARWQTERLYSYRWYLVALWMVVPFAGIALALCVYWPQLSR
ncbi:MAG TPA: hypothetical protein VMR25_09115 [Planctomycetaceae bacterium]|jgi:hypothetical protein|nr:hypothetical protein [Planctomycetaceae bacterium]